MFLYFRDLGNDSIYSSPHYFAESITHGEMAIISITTLFYTWLLIVMARRLPGLSYDPWYQKHKLYAHTVDWEPTVPSYLSLIFSDTTFYDPMYVITCESCIVLCNTLWSITHSSKNMNYMLIQWSGNKQYLRSYLILFLIRQSMTNVCHQMWIIYCAIHHVVISRWGQQVQVDVVRGRFDNILHPWFCKYLPRWKKMSCFYWFVYSFIGV